MNKKSFDRITNFKTCCIVWLRALLYPIPFYALIYLPRYFYNYFRYIALQRVEIVPNRLIDMHPCLSDRLFSTPFDSHYFFQGAWLARKISLNTPADHVDIGSSVLTIGVLSGFVRTTFIDFRPLQISLPGLACRPGDILHLPFESETIQSLSCLHVIEHIGLGRYGDPLDPSGSLKAAMELQRILKSGGSLYVTTPVGRERICFNAHRIFSPSTICAWFTNLELVSFSCVDDQGQYHDNVCIGLAVSLQYGCGMFHFRKI